MKDRDYLINTYNATSTEHPEGSDEIETYEHWLERQLLSRIERLEQIDSHTIAATAGSWLDHHILNEDSEIDGVIIKHHDAPEIYGGVAVKTMLGNFGIIKEDQKEAAKNKGARVRVKPHKEYYGTVMILQYL